MSRLRLRSIIPALLLLAAAVPTAAAASRGRATPTACLSSPSSGVKHVNVNGIKIGYRVLGRGRPLLLIPGYGFTMFDWDPKFISALSAKHRVVLFDNRGVATSTTRGRHVTIAQMATDTAGLIRALRLSHPDVLGWSMGGYIAQDLVLAQPRLAHRLVLASTDFGGGNAIGPSPKVVHELEHLQNPKVLLRVLFPPGAQKAGQAWEGRIYGQATRLGAQSCLGASPVIIGEQLKAAAGWEGQGHGSYPRLPRLRTRTLIAAGVQDVIVPVGNARLLYAQIRDSKLALYGGAGHAFLFQDPFAVARRINVFLG